MKIHQLSVAEALASLSSGPEGLSSQEAERRRREYGPNRVEEIPRSPLTLVLLKEFTHFFSVVLWLAAGLAFLMEWITPGEGMARLGYVVIAVIVISSLFSFWQEFRVEKALAALRNLLPRQVPVLRDGGVMELAAEQLAPGDVILLEQGANIPADCRLIEAFGVRVNNATITGESAPQVRETGPSLNEHLLQGENILLAGTSLVAGRAKAVVFATGMRTEFGSIAHLTQTGGEEVSPLRREIAYLSRLIIVLAMAIGLIFFAIGGLMGVPLWEDFIFTIGIIVAMVPEGLLPTLTLALVLATQRMVKRNVLIRHLPAVEALGSTTVICTDKTGTLTQNRMTVTTLFLGRVIDVAQEAGLEPSLAQDYRPFFLAAALCHDLAENNRRSQVEFLGDPMEVALVELARRSLREAPPWPRIEEIPFDTDRMRLSTAYKTPAGAMLFCKGAPEKVLALCNRTLVAGETCPFAEELRQSVQQAHELMAGRGLRVLAFAYRPVPAPAEGAPLEQELIFAGLAGLADPPRPEVPEAIRRCRNAGIKVIMVTGDHPRTALAIARDIGLVHSPEVRVISGEQLNRLSSIQLQLALDAPEIVFARVSADQKMRIVDALKHKQQIVAVTGDGVNDAPALKTAHIGIAMGIAGTDVAKEAADMVLLDDNFASIVNAVEEGRAVFDNIRKFLTYILAHNVAELTPYLAFALFGIPLALTPIQVLAIDMGTDSLTALGLGVEKPNPQVMERPPRPPRERLLDRRLALRAYAFLGLFEGLAAMAAFLFVLHSAGWRYGQPLPPSDPLYLQATTACLSTIVVLQIVNVFLCRSATRSMFATGLLGNPLILWGVLLEVALILLFNYTAWGNSLLGTAPLGADVWLFILPFAAALLALEETRKWLAAR